MKGIIILLLLLIIAGLWFRTEQTKNALSITGKAVYNVVNSSQAKVLWNETKIIVQNITKNGGSTNETKN